MTKEQLHELKVFVVEVLALTAYKIVDSHRQLTYMSVLESGYEQIFGPESEEWSERVKKKKK